MNTVDFLGGRFEAAKVKNPAIDFVSLLDWSEGRDVQGTKTRKYSNGEDRLLGII